MHRFVRLGMLIALAALCRFAATPAASATTASRAKPLPPARPAALSAPTPAPASFDSTCSQPLLIGEVTLCSANVNFNFSSGDFQFPATVHGSTGDGTYRADRGYGNLHSQIVYLVGHVVVHRNATRDKAGKPVAAMTLDADQTHIESKAKFYRASGNVKIVQGTMTMTAPLIVDDESHRSITASGGVKIMRGDQTLTAPQMTLDENTHVADLTGGVHAEQKPDRSFDAPQVLYNTQTQDFKAMGGVRMQFPAQQPVPRPSPTPRSGGRTRSSPAPSASATPTPSASTRP